VLQQRLNRLTETLGALPQADIVEPYADEPWELRVTVPDLRPEGWIALRSATDLPDLRLLPGCPTGARFGLDCAELDFEEGPGMARRSFVGEEEYRRPLLRGREPDSDTRALELELVTAYRSVESALYMESDRGMDTGEIVIEPCTGRFGLRLCFPAVTLEVFEDLAAGREAVFAAVEQVILARAQHPTLRLWPRVEWSSAGGLELCLWMLGPHMPAYPGDMPEVSRSGIPSRLGESKRLLEILLVPVDETAHRPMAEAAGELIDASDLPLTGSWPRWVLCEDGRRRFAAGWWFEPEKLEQARAVYAWAQRRSDVYATYLIPQSAPALEADWRQLDPVWYGGENRVILISREMWSGRDRCLALRGRAPEAGELPLFQVSQPDFMAPPQAVFADDRPGVLWRLSPAVWQPERLKELIAQADRLPARQLGPVLDLGFDLNGGWLLGWT